ncbi:MAG TPA: hypothetical protein VF713_12235 [Thermoanaerobaculia bacterium]
MPNHTAAIRKYDSSASRITATPKPAFWMMGCYSIQRPEVLRWALDEPGIVELTARPDQRFRAQQLYEVWVDGSKHLGSSWSPVSEAQLELRTGNGFYGCVYTLTRAEGGLRGAGRRWSDVPIVHTPDLPVFLRRVPCTASAPTPD